MGLLYWHLNCFLLLATFRTLASKFPNKRSPSKVTKSYLTQQPHKYKIQNPFICFGCCLPPVDFPSPYLLHLPVFTSLFCCTPASQSISPSISPSALPYEVPPSQSSFARRTIGQSIGNFRAAVSKLSRFTALLMSQNFF